MLAGLGVVYKRSRKLGRLAADHANLKEPTEHDAELGMSTTGGYPPCGLCGKGLLVPVHMGKGPDRPLTYRCTNPACLTRFDEHGYETFDAESETWKRVAEG